MSNVKGWLNRAVFVSCKVLSDVLLMKSILKDLEVIYKDVSLLEDNKALISFKEDSNLQSFLLSKDSFKDFFILLDV